jgi:RNA 2',3'-cyclic 3'-phosphodiesterase
MTELLRAFIAVALPEPLTGFVSEVQRALKALGLSIAWVPPANVHLTLKFLGDIEPADIEPIAAVMTECARQVTPLVLSAGRLGVFPDLRRPRVVWMGIAGDIPQLIALQQDLEVRLDPVGKGRFKPEQRPFKGHLTLGRIKTRLESGLLVSALRQTGQATSHAFTVDAMHLIQSRLTPSGSIYTPLRSVILAGPVISNG